MKIRVINKSYEEVMCMPQYVHKKPIHQLGILRPILKALCWILLKRNGFTYEKIGMDKLKKGDPCLVLMNHSSFIDLEIAAFLMADYVGVPYSNIVVRAILPAILYFAGIFIAVHLEAKKEG